MKWTIVSKLTIIASLLIVIFAITSVASAHSLPASLISIPYYPYHTGNAGMGNLHRFELQQAIPFTGIVQATGLSAAGMGDLQRLEGQLSKSLGMGDLHRFEAGQ